MKKHKKQKKNFKLIYTLIYSKNKILFYKKLNKIKNKIGIRTKKISRNYI